MTRFTLTALVLQPWSKGFNSELWLSAWLITLTRRLAIGQELSYFPATVAAKNCAYSNKPHPRLLELNRQDATTTVPKIQAKVVEFHPTAAAGFRPGDFSACHKIIPDGATLASQPLS
ncbi:hypothetical protein TUM17386_38210 [Shewanella algae]|nr:hypothetical protein TUM17386_38210 [Shewanella algae]